MPNPLHRLRYATKDAVTASLEGAYVALPLTTSAEVLEAVQRLVDHLYGDLET